jgi:hypothetical protein
MVMDPGCHANERHSFEHPRGLCLRPGCRRIQGPPTGGGLTSGGQGSCRGPADNDRTRSQRHASAGNSSGVTLLAEARIVIEPRRMDLRVRIWLPEGGRDPFRPRGLDSVADPAVPGSDPPNSRCHLPGSRYSPKTCQRSAFHCSHSAGTRPGARSSIRVARDPHTAHCGAATIPIAKQAIVVSPERCVPRQVS